MDACNNIIFTSLQCLFFIILFRYHFDTNYLFSKGTTCHLVIGLGDMDFLKIGVEIQFQHHTM